MAAAAPADAITTRAAAAGVRTGDIAFVKSELALVLARVERKRLGSEQEAAEAQQLLSVALTGICKEISQAASTLLLPIGYQQQQQQEEEEAADEVDEAWESGQQQGGRTNGWHALIEPFLCQLLGLQGILQSLAVAGLADFMDPSSSSSSGQGLPEAELDLEQLLLEEEEEEQLWAVKRQGDEREQRLQERREGWVKAGVGVLQQVQELHWAADYYALPGVLGWAAMADAQGQESGSSKGGEGLNTHAAAGGRGEDEGVVIDSRGVESEDADGEEGIAKPGPMGNLWAAVAALLSSCCGRMEALLQEGCLLENRLAEQAAETAAAESPKSDAAADAEDEDGGLYSMESLQEQWVALEESFATCLHEGLGSLLGIADVGVVGQLVQALLQEEQPLLPMLQHWATEVGHLGWGSPQLHDAWGAVVLLLLSTACSACRQQQKAQQGAVAEQLQESWQWRGSIGVAGGGSAAAVAVGRGEVGIGGLEHLPLDFEKYQHMVMTLRALGRLVLGAQGGATGAEGGVSKAVEGEAAAVEQVSGGKGEAAAATAIGKDDDHEEEVLSPAATTALLAEAGGRGGKKHRRFKRRPWHKNRTAGDAETQQERVTADALSTPVDAGAPAADDGGDGIADGTAGSAAGEEGVQDQAAEVSSTAGSFSAGLHTLLDDWLLRPALLQLQQQVQMRVQHLSELMAESQEVLERKQQVKQGLQQKQHKQWEAASGSGGGQGAAAVAVVAAAESRGDGDTRDEQLEEGFGELVAFTDFDPAAPGADMLLEEELGGSTDEGGNLGADPWGLDEDDEEWLRRGGESQPLSESGADGEGAAGSSGGDYGGGARELVAFTDFDPALPGADVDLEGEGLLWDAPLEEEGQEGAGGAESSTQKVVEGVGVAGAAGSSLADDGREGDMGLEGEELEGAAAAGVKVVLLSESSPEVQELVGLLGNLQQQLGQVQVQRQQQEVRQGLLLLVQLLQQQWLHHLAAFKWLWEDVLEGFHGGEIGSGTAVPGGESTPASVGAADAPEPASPSAGAAADTSRGAETGASPAGEGSGASEAAWKLQLDAAVANALRALGCGQGALPEVSEVLHSPGQAYQQYLSSPEQLAAPPAIAAAAASGASSLDTSDAEGVQVLVPNRRQLLLSWQSCVEGIAAVEEQLVVWQEGCAAACVDLHRGLVLAAQQQHQQLGHLPADPDMCLKVGGNGEMRQLCLSLHMFATLWMSLGRYLSVQRVGGAASIY